MWFGTKDGLNRFDGYNFKVFRHRYKDSTSLPDDLVNCINSDVHGNLWVGTEKGIGLLNSKTLQFSILPIEINNHQLIKATHWTNGIEFNKKGDVFFACNELGLLCKETGKANAYVIPLQKDGKKLDNYTASAITVDQSDNVWVMVNNVGLCFYDHKSSSLKVCCKIQSLASSLKIVNSKFVWIGTTTGLLCYEIPSKKMYSITSRDSELNNCKIFDLLVTKSGQLWAATDGKGIIYLTSTTNPAIASLQYYKVSNLSSDAINALYEDELGRKWVGTLRGGIDILNDKKHQFTTYSHQPGNSTSLNNNFTFSFCEDGDDVWVGTDGGGVSLWKRATGRFTEIPTGSLTSRDQVSGNRISSITRDHESQIWIGIFGGEGVKKFNRNTNRFDPVPFSNRSFRNPVWKLYTDLKGRIFASILRGNSKTGGNNRLFRYDVLAKELKPVNFPVNQDILTITSADDQHLWLGSFTSLLKADLTHGIKEVLNFGAAVRTLHQSASGLLWIGTYGRGLFVYNIRTGKLTNYTEANGLCNNKVLNIEEDIAGNIWASTNYGLSKFNKRSGKIENYYAADGLQSNQFYYNASVRLHTGELIFGGIKGFTIFNPDSVRQFHDFPPLVISGVRLANLSVGANSNYLPGADNIYQVKKLTLPYDKAIISLDYAALEYSLPGKIQYAYLLQGRDKVWNFVGSQRSINYSHLNEGAYTLRIKSTNSSGLWNTVERRISIVILPPWYRAWWAYVFYFTLIFGSIYGYLFYHRKQTSLKYELKFIEEINEKKISFFTNIAHELRTPLTLIVNPLKDLLQSDGANRDLIDLSSVYRNSRRLLNLVDQIMLFKKSENEIADLDLSVFTLREVCLEVFICFNNQARSKGIFYEFSCVNEHAEMLADREKIEIVLFNLLSNALKYTPVGGTVRLDVSLKDNQVLMLVEDSGEGIPSHVGDKLFDKFYRLSQSGSGHAQSGFGIGLFLAKKFVELHKGAISYTNRVEGGTSFNVLLPQRSVRPIDQTRFETASNSMSNTLPLLQEIAITDAASEPLQSSSVVRINSESGAMDEIVQNRAVVLLIDDDEEIRSYVKSLLDKSYLVLEAGNAEAGFELVLEHHPDIIVCDVIMPGKSGVEFCSDMKDAPSLSHIPIVLLTGTSSPEIKLKGIECGADDYISKPFESDLLVAKIKSLLKGRDTLKNYFFNEITLKNNELKVPAEYSDFLHKCIVVIENHLENEEFTVIVLAEELNMSRSKLFRKIKSICGLTGSEFIRYIRLRKAAELMIQTDLQIKEIAYKVGFQDIKYFREQFQKLFKTNPSGFIKKYRGAFLPAYKLNPTLKGQKSKSS
ncbi:response regulator [Mucilaginibacter sp. PAMB04274]|uniref:response regulator n=1 Tax=Mucilaginibacter sp. PAMB04274 TaxID=3138568 RepID=UPI0031F6671A